MFKPTTTERGRNAYAAVRDSLAAELGATPGQMMGNPMLYLRGKGFAGVWGDAMIFKLEGEPHAEALAMPDARLFDPSGAGRPMKAWVQVPLASSAEWLRLARLAAESLLALA